MKKLLLFALAAVMGMPVLAQDEIGDDVTKYIANAGFDEDLTFQADGSMKEAISTNTSLSDRSWAYIAADSTVYARPKTTSGQSRPDGRKLEAVNGFIGRVNGWTIETNQTFPKCEWVYFGTVPYDLANQSVPIADDGSTYLEVPARPDAVEGENTGFAYLRAGWGGRAVYKQTVKLPCAKYLLEYWAININPSATNGTNLSKVTCRKDVWEDETGFNDTEWTKHEIEFTPTSEFTIEFGFESSGGSGANPFLCIDGIKLTKIDDADEVELLQSDCWDYLGELETLQGEFMDYQGLVKEIGDLIFDLQDASGSDDVVELRKALEDIKAAIAKYTALKDDVAAFEDLLTEAEQLAYDTDYPGKADFEAAIKAAQDALENGGSAAITEGLANLQKAIRTYYASQDASMESPADYTFAVQHPWFCNPKAQPTLEDGFVTYPVDDPAAEENSEGWYIGASGGDQRLNYVCERTCWNAWNTSFQTISINQDLTDLPQGFYKVAADMITQNDCLTTQHVYATSSLGTVESPVLTEMGWDSNIWETLQTTDAVIVVDGKLTIGAASTGNSEEIAEGYGDYRKGWFCVTNFKLLYCGPATDEQVAEALAARVKAVTEKVQVMHFAADRTEAEAALAAYNETQDLDKLTEAATLAETSEAKYDEIMAAGKTIPTVEAGLADGTYGSAAPIAQFALNYVKNYIASAEASYKDVDSKLTEVKNYTDTYIPVYQEAEEILNSTKSEAVKNVLTQRLAAHVNLLVSEMKDAATVNEYVEELKSLIYEVNKQEAYESDPDATDYTAFIQNPMAEAQTGWEIECTDGPIKSGQWYTGDSSVRYFDSWNATAGALTFYGEQTVLGLPNGTYTIGVDVRTSGEGAYVFSTADAEKAGKNFVEIPLQYYTHPDDETGEEVTDEATDKWGQIWEDAVARYESMTDSDPDYYYLMGIVNANSGQGRGWEHLDIEGVVVKDHVLTIGMAANAGGAPKEFTGTWFSVNNWTLTMTAKGDNTGWDGPLATGISEVTTGTKAVDGVYTVSGVRTGKLQKGLNIVVIDGKATKVLVK